MNIDYTGRQTTVTPKWKAQAEAGLARVEKVANRCTHAHVVFTEDKYRRIVEITLNCRGEQLVALCEATDFEQALHDAVAKVETQAVKHKDKHMTVRDHSAKPAAIEAA